MLANRAPSKRYCRIPNFFRVPKFRLLDRVVRTAMHAHVVLLWIPPGALRQRSLYRVDRQMWSEGFLDYYGSEAEALKEMAAIQELRYEGIRQSRIPHTVIDTSNRDWDAYAQTISTLSADQPQ